jgi:putative heme-binding domain-containing protein
MSHACLRALGVAGVWLSTVAGIGLLAQHTAQPPDTVEGRRLYESMCVRCHGPDGRSVPGVNLGAGEFTRASSDDELMRIIKEGISGSAMPAAKVSDQEAANIVGYLHKMAAPAEPAVSAVARGKALFEANCVACHRMHRNTIVTAGPEVRGPNLSRIGVIRKPDELRRSILDPDAEVLLAYRTFRGTMRDGSMIVGRVANEDTFTVQIISRDGRLISITKSDLTRFEFLNQSPMPSYRDKLTPGELDDLVAYLASL